MTEKVIVSTRDRPGPYDGLESAKPGEIVFTVQGGDPFGPATVLAWVRLARLAGMEETDPDKSRALLRKATAAEEVAWAMRAQQRGEGEALPARRATYQDSETVAETLAAVDRRETLAKGADVLHNSLAEALLVAESLAKLREFPEAEVAIRKAVEKLKEAAMDIEPRRHLRRGT